VTSASSFGRVLTKIEATLDKSSGDFTAMSANNLVVTRDVTPMSALTALVAKYQALTAPLANRVIGSITEDITRTTNAAGESTLGDVIADAQLDATNDPGFGEAVVAFMNPGGIRQDLLYAQISGGELPGEVTYGEMFTVQPFGNSMVTMTLTGAQIKAVLEQQFNNPSVGQNRILQASGGFTYSWSASAPIGSKVSNIMLDGTPLDMTASYRVTVNSFLADGGDNFSVLKQGTNRLGGEVDTDAFEKYFISNEGLLSPGPQNRITLIP
jgi:5'-nucleotidase